MLKALKSLYTNLNDRQIKLIMMKVQKIAADDEKLGDFDLPVEALAKFVWMYAH